VRIAFDYQIFSSQAYGGISRYFTRLIEEVSLQEQNVCVFAPLHRNVYLKNLPSELVRGRFCSPIPRTGRILSYYNRIIGGIQERGWKPDILHETYYTKNRIVSAGSPTVVTVYDMIHEIFPGNFSACDRTSSKKRSAIDRADHLVCISENTRRDLVHLFKVPECKTSVVHLGFDHFQKRAHLALTSNYSLKRPYILYVGSRWGYKNFSVFLKAYAQSNNIKKDFYIVAFGGGSFSAKENSLFQELALDPKRIHQISGDDSELGEIYSNAHAFIYPSLYEGFGLPPLEAMAHKCPVASSSTSSMPEVIGEAAEFFDPHSTEEMMVALDSVVYDEERRKDLIRKGELRIEHFSWKRCAAETLAIYKKIV
jgi:glycosyltransferase involved in cell wall biosynthesis